METYVYVGMNEERYFFVRRYTFRLSVENTLEYDLNEMDLEEKWKKFSFDGCLQCLLYRKYVCVCAFSAPKLNSNDESEYWKYS